MDMIVQGIQSIKEETSEARPKAGPKIISTTTGVEEKEEEEEAEEKMPAWRMRVKSITARSPTILVDATNTSRRPVPLGEVIAAGIPRHQQGPNNQEK
jgi:hypothetical protein